MGFSRNRFVFVTLKSSWLRRLWPEVTHAQCYTRAYRILGQEGARAHRAVIPVVMSLVALATISMLSPVAYASAPGPDTPLPVPSSSAPAIPGTGGYVKRSPEFVAEKNAFQIYSGIHVNPATGSAKGTKQPRPYIVSTSSATVAYSAPAAFELSTSNPVPGSWEPANGCNPNFGSNTSQYDDNGSNYCKYTQATSGGYSVWGDKDFPNLCGPGAADNALWYWPKPNNTLASNWASDTAPMTPIIATTWTSERMRAYMSYLAWQIAWPSGGLSHYGMMGNTTYPSYGTTLYGMQDALNWEETGETTLNGFYLIQWWNQASQTNLNQDVVFDTSSNGTPIVAEVNAALLPNWNTTGHINHFITIIGYDNNSSIYYYTDTCGATTGCNVTGNGTDGQVHTVSQSTMWNAITNIPVNTNTGEAYGDGGWVW